MDSPPVGHWEECKCNQLSPGTITFASLFRSRRYPRFAFYIRADKKIPLNPMPTLQQHNIWLIIVVIYCLLCITPQISKLVFLPAGAICCFSCLAQKSNNFGSPSNCLSSIIYHSNDEAFILLCRSFCFIVISLCLRWVLCYVLLTASHRCKK